jgi:hypothetical protein
MLCPRDGTWQFGRKSISLKTDTTTSLLHTRIREAGRSLLLLWLVLSYCSPEYLTETNLRSGMLLPVHAWTASMSVFTTIKPVHGASDRPVNGRSRTSRTRPTRCKISQKISTRFTCSKNIADIYIYTGLVSLKALTYGLSESTRTGPCLSSRSWLFCLDFRWLLFSHLRSMPPSRPCVSDEIGQHTKQLRPRKKIWRQNWRKKNLTELSARSVSIRIEKCHPSPLPRFWLFDPSWLWQACCRCCSMSRTRHGPSARSPGTWG